MNRLCNIVLLVAQSCNLRCRYCYAKGGDYGGEQQLMQEQTLGCALEKLLPLCGPGVTVSFFGGEPLLNLPLMRRAVGLARRLCKATGRKVRFAMTTNGTLLDDEAIGFIREHINSLAVSLDGEASVNDEERRFRRGNGSVHSRVLKSLARLKVAGVPFALRATLTPHNAPFVLPSARHLAALGPVSLRMLPDFADDDWSTATLRALTEGFDGLHRDALERLLGGGEPLGAEALYPLLENRIHGWVRERRCEVGEAMLTVAADGSVFPCDHFVGRPVYFMGRVQAQDFPSAGFERVRHRLAEMITCSRAACGGCSAEAFCGGECPADAASDAASRAAFCYFKRAIFADLQARLDRLSPQGVLPEPIVRQVER
jgi:uncharacterized protein